MVVCKAKARFFLHSYFKIADFQDNLAADEANFIHQFPMAGLLTVQSLIGLEMQLMTVWTGLKSKDWRKRRRVRIVWNPCCFKNGILFKSLHLVREMVSCGAGQLEQFVDILLNWTEGVKSCLMDVRTQVRKDMMGWLIVMLISMQVVRDCCITVAYLAQEVGCKVGQIRYPV